MKIQCPKCKQIVPPDQVNMATDLAFCPLCNDGFKISEMIDQEPVSADVLRDPPKGAWLRKEMDRVVVGASTRSPIAFFLIPFMCVWSGGSLGGIYGSQIAKGKFDLTMSLFGIPFLLGTLLFGSIALMSAFGKVEVSIGRESFLFIGVGPFGWKRPFDWMAVKSIREDSIRLQRSNGSSYAVVMDGPQRLRITGITEPRRIFVMNALKYLRDQTPAR